MFASNSKPAQSRHAYGTFVFKDSGYLPGLLMVAYKIKKLSKRKATLICLYTPDVDGWVLEVLKLLYDEIRPTEYLKFGRKRTGRQQPLPSMFTRFRFLELTEFDKVLVLDADMLPLQDYASIFKLSAPAGVINESKEHMQGTLKTLDRVSAWEWHEKYRTIAPPGSVIPKDITDRPLLEPKDNLGINGGLMLLQPSASDFVAFTKWCNQPEISAKINAMNWPDMQAITAFYSGKWASIDAKYLGLYGYPNVSSLNGIHFIGPKPWQHRSKGFEHRISMYPDYRLWAKEYLEMCEAIPPLMKHTSLRTLYKRISTVINNLEP